MAGPDSLREQKRTFTRSRLVAAAREVIERKGYASATVDDIAAAAGASRATFYLHFANKDSAVAEIVAEVGRYAVERYRALDELLTSARPDRRDQLRAWLADWLEYWRGTADLQHALSTAVSINREIERQMLDISSVTLIEQLEGFLGAQPSSERARIKDRAIILETMTSNVFAQASRDLMPATDDAVVDYLTETWEALFLAR